MKEEGSFVLKDMKTKAEEEALANRPPPPPPPPIPPPPEKKLDDYDLTGFSGAALFIFNGVITGIKGAHMIESGLLTGLMAAWAAERLSTSPANAYFGALTWTYIGFSHGWMAYAKKPSFISNPVMCATGFGMAARYYYLKLQYEMKTKAEKESMEQW